MMDYIASKLRKVLKIVGIGMLIAISITSWVKAGAYHMKSKDMITCDGDSSDTIILAQERSRGRVFFDVLKKMSFNSGMPQNTGVAFQFINPFKLKSLLVNAYQRNVFYVYAFSTVP